MSEREQMTLRADTRQFEATKGLWLTASTWGYPDNAPVVLLHGGGQTRHSWGAIGEILAEAGFYAVAVDMRGHGDSPWAPDGDYSWATLAGDLARICDQLVAGPMIVGASAGGLVSLAAVGGGQVRARGLVLVDIVLDLEPVGVNRIRDFMQARPDGFASLEEAADFVAGYLPDRPRPTDPSGLAKNLRRGADGRLRWHWDPRWVQGSEGHLAGIAQLAESAARIAIPTLVVRGGSSDVVSQQGVEHFLRLVPHADYVDVAGAGHMIAGDRNDAFAEAVTSFLRSLPRSPQVVGRRPGPERGSQ
ncbi:MAG: alpha/beta hydrolase [Actinomycetota bacterium]